MLSLFNLYFILFHFIFILFHLHFFLCILLFYLTLRILNILFYCFVKLKIHPKKSQINTKNKNKDVFIIANIHTWPSSTKPIACNPRNKRPSWDGIDICLCLVDLFSSRSVLEVNKCMFLIFNVFCSKLKNIWN